MKKNELASIISHVFSPAAVAVVLFVWLSVKSDGGGGGGNRWQAVAVALGTYALIPSLVLVALRRLGFIRDLYEPQPAHRQRILSAGFYCYLAGYGALTAIEAPAPLLWCSACFSAGAALVWLINHFWKISIHATGIGGGAFMLVEVSGLWVLPGIAVVALAVAWSRLCLGAHSQSQVIAGFLLGACQAWALLPLYRPLTSA